MAYLNKIKSILIMFLILVVIWVAFVIYFNTSEVKIEGEFVALEVDLEYTLVDEEIGFEEEAPSSKMESYISHIDDYFVVEGFENMLVRIEENLIVEPQVFHDLQSDAIIEKVEEIEEQIDFD